MFIKDIYELANLLNMEPRNITYILYKLKSQNCYSYFEIPKKNGDKRKIYSPNKILSNIQRKVLTILEARQEVIFSENNIVNKISHGFQKRKNIITNAVPHKNKRYIINVDLKDFFESFHFGRVRGYFMTNKHFEMSKDVSKIIAILCCYNGALPQGAPTSPFITNLIFQSVDNRILKLCRKYKLDYTRYADDLTFSTNDKNFINNKDVFLLELKCLIERAGFKINNAKTRIQDKHHKQKVTGLTVNKIINVDKNFAKQTKAMALSLYKNNTFEINGNKASIKQLEGRFAFINLIDKYNSNNTKKRNFASLNTREKQYQLFLFYKNFICNSKPIIITEGKTDGLYIKAALMANYEKYPLLITKNKNGTFSLNFTFLRKTPVLEYFFKMNKDGATCLTQCYNYYTKNDSIHLCYKKLKKYGVTSTNPCILLYDNETVTKDKPLNYLIHNLDKKYRETITNLIKTTYFSKIPGTTNLYVATIPLINDKVECEIEDLLPDDVLTIKIDDKSFSRKGGEQFFGKEILSKYVYDNYKKIDFSSFIKLLDTIQNIIKKFKPSPLE